MTTEPVWAASTSGLTDAVHLDASVWPLLIIVLVAIAATARHWRIHVASGLALLLVVFACEEAVHSVHHGLGPVDAKGCAVAAASVHLTGAMAAAVTSADVILPPVEEHRVEPSIASPAVFFRSPVQQRAPPA